MIFYVMTMAMQNPITIIMQASGNIKMYHLLADTVLLMCIPASWGLFKLGMPAFVILVSMISVCVLAHIVRLFCLRRNYSHFSIKDYFLKFVVPFVLFTLIAFSGSYLIHELISNLLVRFLLVTLVTVILLVSMVFLFGMTAQEKAYVQTFISKYIKIKK